MKKQFTLFAASTLAAMTFVPMVGFAAETTPAGPITYDSKGTVEFVAPTKPTDPLNPNNPDPNHPVKPNHPEGTPDHGTDGPLSLDFASSLDFGKQEIISTDQTYKASAQKLSDNSYVPDYVQLTDNRGTFKGWTLQVKETDSFATKGGAKLTGTEIKFGNTDHTTTNKLTDTAVTKADEFTLTPDMKSAFNVMFGAAGAANAKNTADEKGVVANDANSTSGTHILRFGTQGSLKTDEKQANGEAREDTVDPSVTLKVPGASDKVAQKYSTTIEWTLGDTPNPISVK